MNTDRNWGKHDAFGHGRPAAWSLPRNSCFERCVEVGREAQTANLLRALIARMVEFVPEDHPLAAEARDVLE